MAKLNNFDITQNIHSESPIISPDLTYIEDSHDDGDYLYADDVNIIIGKTNKLLSYVQDSYTYVKNELKDSKINVDNYKNLIDLSYPNVTYKLEIDKNRKIGFTKFTDTTFGECTLSSLNNSTKTDIDGNNLIDATEVTAYGIEYPASILTAYDYNMLSCNIIKGSNNIAITGIYVNSLSSYTYGGPVNIIDGVAYIYGNPAQYSNGDISKSFTWNTSYVQEEHDGGQLYDALSYTTSSHVTNVKLYVHTKGSETLLTYELEGQSDITWVAAIGVCKQYSVWIGDEKFNNSQLIFGLTTPQSDKPENIMFDATYNEDYIWIASPYKLNYIGFTSISEASYFIQEYTYNDIIYYIYRTTNKGIKCDRIAFVYA